MLENVKGAIGRVAGGGALGLVGGSAAHAGLSAYTALGSAAVDPLLNLFDILLELQCSGHLLHHLRHRRRATASIHQDGERAMELLIRLPAWAVEPRRGAWLRVGAPKRRPRTRRYWLAHGVRSRAPDVGMRASVAGPKTGENEGY